MSGAPANQDVILERAAVTYDTPVYVYFTDGIAKKLDQLKSAFGDRFAISYAVKSNPNPGLLGWLKSRIEYLDVSSVGEFHLGRRAGWEPSRLSFTGPGKREFELRDALEGGLGELIVESVAEAVMADRIAGSIGIVQDIMIRISPDQVPKGFGDQMAGRPSAFGIDIETAHDEIPAILDLPNLKLTGLHIYSGTQCLIPGAICENYRQFLRIFRDLGARYDLTPEKLVFGSGLGIPYFENDKELDLEAIADGFLSELDAFRQEPRFQSAKLVLEMGRFLVGESGYFVTRVVATKNSRGTRIGVCDGGLNNHLAATGNFGMVIHRNYRMHKVGGGEPVGKINLAGPLCTPLDRIAVGVSLPEISVGDLIAVHNSGAYGLTSSPIHFISHRPPREILVEGDELRDVTRALGDIAPGPPVWGDGV
jgi:diaminopimelate decarboxylase